MGEIEWGVIIGPEIWHLMEKGLEIKANYGWGLDNGGGKVLRFSCFVSVCGPDQILVVDFQTQCLATAANINSCSIIYLLALLW